MIETNHGEITIKGNGVEIAADLLVIFNTVIEESPISLAVSLMEFENKLTSMRAEHETEERIKALASVFSMMPKEELEALKKKAEEGKHDGSDL